MATAQDSKTPEHRAEGHARSSVAFWLGPLLAATVYLSFRVLVPGFYETSEQPDAVVAGRLRAIAPFLAAAVLVLWVLAVGVKVGDRQPAEDQFNLRNLRALSWAEFERLVGEAFKRRGYTVAAQPGPDGVFDLILTKDGEKTFVRCRNWKSSRVGVETIQETHASVVPRGAAGGVVICCGHFAPAALKLAQDLPLELIDGLGLWRMILKVRSEPPGGDAANAS